MWPASIDKLKRLPFASVANEALGLAAPGTLAQAVRGRTVIVGTSTSWSDRTMTPSGQLSGSEVLAVAYAALAQNAIAQDAPTWLNILMLLMALLLLALPMMLLMPAAAGATGTSIFATADA